METKEIKSSRLLKPKEFDDFLDRNYSQILHKSKISDTTNLSSSKTVHEKCSHLTNLYEKGIELMQHKTDKINKKKQQKERCELIECTFRPELIPRIKTLSPIPSHKKKKGRIEGYSKVKLNSEDTIKYIDKNNIEFRLRIKDLTNSK